MERRVKEGSDFRTLRQASLQAVVWLSAEKSEPLKVSILTPWRPLWRWAGITKTLAAVP